MLPAFILNFKAIVFGRDTEFDHYLVNTLMTLAPVLNPYVCIYFIKAYRQTVIDIFLCQGQARVGNVYVTNSSITSYG